MIETYIVEYMQINHNSSSNTIDRAASVYHDLEATKEHAFETFRLAQTSRWGGPMLDAFRILNEKHEILFQWTVSDEKKLQQINRERRLASRAAAHPALGLETA